MPLRSGIGCNRRDGGIKAGIQVEVDPLPRCTGSHEVTNACQSTPRVFVGSTVHVAGDGALRLDA